MNQNIQELKQEAQRPVITSITMYDKDNFVNFSDTDTQTDYFNNRTLGTNSLVEYLKCGDAGQIIKVEAVNNDYESKHYKRIDKFAKVLRYAVKRVERKGIYRISDNDKMCYIKPYVELDFYLYDADLVKESEIIMQ